MRYPQPMENQTLYARPSPDTTAKVEAMQPGHDLRIGIDIGSTTVKAVVVAPQDMAILWKAYQRHNGHQAEQVLQLLEQLEASFPEAATGSTRVFVTGSGAHPIAGPLGARFVQEVNAVSMAVERLHPDVHSVAELGGQDAKIILFRRNEQTGERQAWTSMNDRCASGTGATVDKCLIKLGLPLDEVGRVRLGDRPLHPVAAKCGVFAETNVVNLIKSGVPAAEILCSLGDAIVQQNLSLLARGNTLKPRVLLLGGPLHFFPFLQDCWTRRIRETWQERGLALPADVPPEKLIEMPENALYYAAYGAVIYGEHDEESQQPYRGTAALRDFIGTGRQARFGGRAGPPLVADEDELARFCAEYAVPEFAPLPLTPGSTVRAVLGVDGGSTSTKAVLIAEDGSLLRKAYRLSKGNPIQDTKELLGELRDQVRAQGASLDIVGFGATGYAGGVLESTLRADAHVVETVAHMQSAVHLFGDVDVICDVGGQDIKVLFLRNGELNSFRLSNQCSAGNGMLLQATAQHAGISVQEYAEHAFRARIAPRFSYGCAVFLDSDRVNLQREGFSPDEVLAGLAMVLPKNIWQYIVQVPRLEALGHRYVLQGGTQYNLAALKAQVDYIRERVRDARIHVHPHPGEAGALGAAMEALRIVRQRGQSRFVGLDQAIAIEYTARTDESTRCPFCTNYCQRSFISTRTPDGAQSLYVSGFSCERGAVPDIEGLKAYNREQRERARRFPNLVEEEARRLFSGTVKVTPSPEPPVAAPVGSARVSRLGGRWPWRPAGCTVPAVPAARDKLRIGMPRCLDMWSTAPFWRAYFASAGIPQKNLVFSGESGERMFTEGAKYGAVDPCYPAKVVQAHLHDLLFHHHTADRPLNYIFFPTVTQTLGALSAARSYACPVVSGTPNVIKAAFTKETDYFKSRGIEYLDPAVTFGDLPLLRAQLHRMWGARLGIGRTESDRAIEDGLRALAEIEAHLQRRGREILDAAEREDRFCMLLLCRPYHLDPGLNHGVPEMLQALGYPVITLRSIPRDPEYLARIFREDLDSGRIAHPLDIGDVWPEAHTANSSLKVWGIKFAARHPNVAVVDLSSFKCGHDAPIYGLIDKIVTTANVPYLALHDLDANRPTGTLMIRLRTFAHALGLRREHLAEQRRKEGLLDERVQRKREELLARWAGTAQIAGQILASPGGLAP
ncbi:MAG: BadF/BadG/BcrA/BcrD ATPase family protein [SAR324 cluster bacterium]